MTTTFTPASLLALPPPDVVETLEFETVYGALRDDFLARWADLRAINPALPTIDVLNLETDPLAIAFQAFAYRELVLRARVNDATRQNLLAYATGSNLDHLGATSSPPTIRLAGEDDERYRRRILLGAMSRNAGSEERYAYVALSADLRIADAVAYREGRDPTVQVALLSSEAGGIADAPMIAAVEAALANPVNRVVNGPFSVRSAVSSLTNITASLVVHPGTSTQILAAAEANLRAAFATESRLGFDLTVPWIVSRLMVPGVYGVTLTAPAADVVVPPYEMAGIGTVSLSIAGNAL